MTKKQILILLLLMMITPCLRAQKKELSQARSYIKSGKDYDKAERLMTDLLKDSANRENPKILLTWFDAVTGEYMQANEKLYLKQKYDTAAFFNLNLRLFQIAESLDSVDARPDKKGRVRPEYRKDHAEMLHQLRPNIYYGGGYHVRKGQYQDALRFYDGYIDCSRQPLFTGYDYEHTDSLLTQASYWATYCAYKLQQPENIQKYASRAMLDVFKRHYVMQYLAESYLMTDNSDALGEILEKGFEGYPEHPYFFPRLADYYKAAGRHDLVLKAADYGLRANKENPLFLLAKAVALLNLERYDECIRVSQQMIALNDTLAEPYYNIATCYLNQALVLEQQNNPRKLKQQILSYYRQAKPFMEDFRRLMPAEKKRWAPGLYRIYFNLNMGKQFDEIDQLMRK